MTNPSLEIIEEIKRKLPNGTSLIDFFIEILPMKKEAAYRRLRGEIPLTLVEAQSIVSRLNLSFDELLKIKREGTYTSSIVRMNGKNLMESYCKTLEIYIKFFRSIKDPKAKIYSALNVLPNSRAFNYPNICKFRLFKWVYQYRNSLTPPKFSEIEISPKIRDLETIYSKEAQQIASYNVWIRELFGPYISDLHYFSNIGLITKEEIKSLIEETYLLLNEMETDITAGHTKAGAPFLVYLADTYFDSNYIYVEGCNMKVSSVIVFGINFLSSLEEGICDDTRDWIESLMRYSTLISQTGEIEKVNFFNLQRRIIEDSNLTNMYEIYYR